MGHQWRRVRPARSPSACVVVGDSVRPEPRYARLDAPRAVMAGQGALRHGAALISALALLGCARAPAPRVVVTDQNARSVLEPTRLGWVSSELASVVLPSAIGVGGKTSGRVLLYLEFATPTEPRRLLRA